MSAQGLKHAEPTTEKPGERRRGPAGRAAALRRAPSDSDCSGETASLSADSGDRRPAPPPPRTGKTRSRRRGSEWEVLEGLKDGQRFERRPEVFNGYLHKKRKWPLKGWHKRFFVVDAGILVYARSPTDVARGRLHGSLDVGLSVISAKPRRRRIDIDADEFIYHLRAKTPEVFRTWLNVLKAHRLYRQHLLTFGARESVPKIHAPLEELPPTDNTSSRVSHSTRDSFSTLTATSVSSPAPELTGSPTFRIPSSIIESSVYVKNSQNTLKDWAQKESSALLPLKLETIDIDNFELKYDNPGTTGSLCSMCCIQKKIQKASYQAASPTNPIGVEQKMTLTNVDFWETKDPVPLPSPLRNSILLGECALNSCLNTDSNQPMTKQPKKKPSGFLQLYRKDNSRFGGHAQPQTAMFIFSNNKRTPIEDQWVMKRSKKSTNLYKYRNSMEEPPLKKPFSKCLLLGKYKGDMHKSSVQVEQTANTSVVCDLTPHGDAPPQQNKSIQDTLTSSEYDRITEQIVLTLFEQEEQNVFRKKKSVQYYVNEAIKELYNVKLSGKDSNPIQCLFKCLLEYWLKNTQSDRLKNILKRTKAIDKQSNKWFTKDAEMSSDCVGTATKNTQVFQNSEEIVNWEHLYGKKHTQQVPIKTPKIEKIIPPAKDRADNGSVEKERRIQELERLLKSTVYVCEAVRNSSTKEKDINITKTLIQNLDKFSKQSLMRDGSNNREISDASAEIPKIQETLNHLISDANIPPEVAKEVLSVYLDVLLHGDSQPCMSTSQSSDTSIVVKNIGGLPTGDVQTECVQKKKKTKSITTATNEKVDKPSLDVGETIKNDDVDPGRLYLKEILDKLTSIFTNGLSKIDSKSQEDAKDVMNDERKGNAVNLIDNSTHTLSNHQFIYENKEDKSIVIDLARYDLENISMVNEATSKGLTAITIKLKNKLTDSGQYKRRNLNLKLSKEHPQATHMNRLHPWPSQLTTSVLQPHSNSLIDIRNPKICIDPGFPQNKMELKPYLSPSEATSKANHQTLHESDSFDISRQSSNISQHVSSSKKSLNVPDDAQCYSNSSIKKDVHEAHLSDKKKTRLKGLNGVRKSQSGLSEFTCKHREEDTPHEKSTPRIIDEKFILLLLENLTLLSKNLPEMHKEINSLYLKLRKQYERIIKNSNYPPGVSLIEKIFNSKSMTNLHRMTLDRVTQYNVTEKQAAQIAVNTSSFLSGSPKALDISLSAFNPGKTLKHLEVQTETNFDNMQDNRDDSLNPQNGKEPQTSLNIMGFEENPMTDKRDLIQNWSSPDKVVIVPKKSQKKQSAKVRQDFTKRISLLSPSVQAQADKKNNKQWNCLQKDFKVFQLCPMNFGFLARSGSVMEPSVATDCRQKSDDLKTLYRCPSDPSFCSGLISPTVPPVRGPQAGFVAGTPGGRLAGWIIESGGPLESASRELGQAQLSVQQLQRLLDALEHHDTDQVSLEGASPNVKKDRRKFGLRKKKSNSKCASIELVPPLVDASNSHMALSALTAPPSPGGGAVSMPNSAASLPIACAAARPQSLPGAEALGTGGPASLTSLTPDHQLREDFNVLAKDLVASLKTIVSTLVCERGRLRAAVEASEASSPGGVVASLRTNLTSALQQNSELRSRLSRIHDASDLAEVSSVGNNSDPAARPFPQSLSYSSSCVSASEFFDAEEHDDELKPAEIIGTDEAGVIELDGDSSSEAGSLSSEEGSASSDNSDGATTPPASAVLQERQTDSRRARLPCPRPTPASPSLWNLLYKNIGKDLSQVSMPVTINEPLNMLQRLCEELEYSELLDAAAECADAVERMTLIAAFAVSAYASSAHRAASKPFNPLLAETYECVRPDRHFQFIAEQVSHHPPISACHAESPRWTFWQEARIKTKFWGKSMEFQPTGRVHVRLAGAGDHYSWNKVTTCVHNLFGGQRWVDQYGDMHIVCHGTDITCKLNFIKASSWSSSRHEVRGSVFVGGAARTRLTGRWSEGLQAGERPLWRPRAMPPDFELYYGFTRFAMELNEMEPGMREILPSTDTRLRPDQRALEEGDVDAAEQFKHELEQAQRERRRDGLEHRPLWFRKTVQDGEETWVFPGEYWKAREAGFTDTPRLW